MPAEPASCAAEPPGAVPRVLLALLLAAACLAPACSARRAEPRAPELPAAPGTHLPAPDAQHSAPATPANHPGVTAQPGAAEAQRCGPFECRAFASSGEALGFVLADRPLALGVGEAHALAGTERLASSARRFTERLLPELRGRASHLIVELLNPDPRCEAATQETRRAQEPVTRGQSQRNQNDYVELGRRARELGIEPFVLSPTCDEYRASASAGDAALERMLTTIARVSSRMLRAALVKNRSAGREALVVGYGGALHNDIEPAPARADWSYGPELAAFTRGRYVELDVIVREFIKDTDSWRALPWYAHFEPGRDASRWLVMRTAPDRYVLFFPKADAPAPD